MSVPPASAEGGVGSSPLPDPRLSSDSPGNEGAVYRPSLVGRATTKTIIVPPNAPGDPEKARDGDHQTNDDDHDSSDEKTHDKHHHSQTTEDTSPPDPKSDDIANPPEETPRWKRIVMDMVFLLAILFMILWPWVFFGVVQQRKGLQMYGRLADVIELYPQRVAAVVTLLGTVNRLIATFLFGKTVVRLGQELIAANLRREVTVFGVSALLAFRHMSMVWGIGQWRQMKNGKGRWGILVLLLAALGAFALVPSGTAGLITPGQFNKTAELKGTELDFTSTDPGCLAWMEQNGVANVCDWRVISGTSFTMCLSENQILDVLDSGRANMLSTLGLTNETSSLNQLGVSGGIRFLGSARGVLPIGPNGVAIFDTLTNTSNPFADENIRKRMVSYNYTLSQQGLESQVSCSYEDTSPISFRAITGINTTRIIAASGTCDPAAGLEPVLNNITDYTILNTDNTLTYWACKQTPEPGTQPSTYFLYLRGRGYYEDSIGNMTCRISPFRAQSYEVQYLSLPKYFISQPNLSAASPTTTFSPYIEGALIALGNIIWESQNWSSNLVAEAIFSLGAKNLGLSTRQRGPTYLKLYNAMIKGMLDYEGTYSRLIYSVDPNGNRPSTCLRDVNGSVTYSVRGWYIENAATQAGLLLPMTLINVASFSLLIACFVIGGFRYTYNFDATDNISLLTALVPGVDRGGDGQIEWRNKVQYPQTRTTENP